VEVEYLEANPITSINKELGTTVIITTVMQAPPIAMDLRRQGSARRESESKFRQA